MTVARWLSFLGCIDEKISGASLRLPPPVTASILSQRLSHTVALLDDSSEPRICSSQPDLML